MVVYLILVNFPFKVIIGPTKRYNSPKHEKTYTIFSCDEYRQNLITYTEGESIGSKLLLIFATRKYILRWGIAQKLIHRKTTQFSLNNIPPSYC